MDKKWILAVIIGCIGAIIGTAILIAFLDQGSIDSTQNEEDVAILDLIKRNLRACQDEDIESLLTTLHTESPQLNKKTFNTMIQLFETYDLTYKLSELEIMERTTNRAYVRFVQITSKRTGPAFRNNKLCGIFELRKQGGKWKFYSTKPQNIEYLD